MAPPPLTIRNLTNVPLVLKVVERFEPPQPSVERGGKALFANVTSALGVNTSSSPSYGALAPDAQSFERRDTDFRAQPFTTVKTDIVASQRSPNEVLRLILRCEEQDYRIDVPSPIATSSNLVPLGPDPRHDFTGVFIRDDTYLSIYSSANLHCWMQHLKDETPLSALSIPGTHNAPAYHKALPSVRCQARSPKDQLDNGVRFFDVRVQPGSRQSAAMQLVHGVFPISLTGAKQFHDLVQHIYEFLDRNPSETLILSVKREGTGSATDQDLAHVLSQHYISGDNSRRWYTDEKTPSLGQSRGKIVLMRRFGIDEEIKKQREGRGFGIDASYWEDSTPCWTGGNICVQDFYQVLKPESIGQKIEYVEAHFKRAGDCVAPLPGITTDVQHPVPPQPFFLNFLSASNFLNVGCWPDKIAAKLNPAAVKWLCCNHAQQGQGDGSTGIVVTDWVGEQNDWDLVRCIVGMNTKLMAREMAM